jgi:hypothetical protein
MLRIPHRTSIPVLIKTSIPYKQQSLVANKANRLESTASDPPNEKERGIVLNGLLTFLILEDAIKSCWPAGRRRRQEESHEP